MATKVIHLGDQLDNVNGPRTRVVEAQKLMTYLTEFLLPGALTSPLFTDHSRVKMIIICMKCSFNIGFLID